MLNRLRYSLVAPAGIIEYRKDALWKVWAYVLFFALLTSLGPALRIVSETGLSLSVKESMIEHADPSSAGCAIESGRLRCEKATTEVVFSHANTAFVLDSHETLDLSRHRGTGFIFVVHDEHIHLVFLGISVHERRIEMLHEAVHNLDFDYAPEEKAAHFQAVFKAIDAELLALRPLLVASAVLASTVSSLLLFTIVILLNTFLSRVRFQVVPLKELYVMMSYAGTALYIVFVFEALVQFNFLLFIVLLLVAFYQMSKLTFEIQRRIFRK